jgi:hypothetical protein
MSFDHLNMSGVLIIFTPEVSIECYNASERLWKQVGLIMQPLQSW